MTLPSFSKACGYSIMLVWHDCPIDGEPCCREELFDTIARQILPMTRGHPVTHGEDERRGSSYPHWVGSIETPFRKRTT